MLKNKFVGILFKIVKVILVIFTLLVVSVIMIQRVFGNDVSLFGYRVFTIITGSMEPVYGVQDVIIAREVDTTKLVVGDDVVYIGKTGSFEGKIVTHRIIKIEDNEGVKEFHTQGIANTGVDPIVYEDQIYGEVLGRSAILSFINKLVSTPLGFALLIMIPATLLIGSEIYYRLDEKEIGE